MVPQIATWWAEIPCGSPVLRATFHRNRLEDEAPTLANSSMPNNEMTLAYLAPSFAGAMVVTITASSYGLLGNWRRKLVIEEV